MDKSSSKDSMLPSGALGSILTKSNSVVASSSSSSEKRLSRLFSLRKNSSRSAPISVNNNNSHEEDSSVRKSYSQPVVLGSPPPSTAVNGQEALKRRHIVQTLVSSENNYVAALERLLNDYKRPLEESSPPILSPTKVSTLFHRIPDILQIHLLFRIALRGVISTWDTSEKIGDVFVASFSKASVLETYSDFINNFSEASSLLSKASKGSSSFGDFLSLRQISSPDRLSLFGLLVKPVQRFPQFILLLQDLLRETGPGHPDRMALQLALTTLESLAEMLNERKREAERYAAFRDKMKSLGGSSSSRNASGRGLLEIRDSRYLLKEDDVHQLEFNSSGQLQRSKARRLLLVNDALLCVSVSGRFSEVDIGGSSGGAARRRLSLKWAVPVREVEVLEGSGTLSRVLRSGTSGLDREAESLAEDMTDLMTDFETLSRIKSLLGGLKGSYEGLSPSVLNESLSRVQGLIRQKDEEMCEREACLLTLTVNRCNGTGSSNSNSNSNEHSSSTTTMSFQTADPSARREWVTELRLAQLALDPENSPAWDVLEDERNALAKLPLYVKALPVLSEDKSLTELSVGVSYTLNVPGAGRTPKPTTYIWVSAVSGGNSILKVFSHPSYRELASLRHKSIIKHMEFVPGIYPVEELSLRSSLVWVSTKRMIIIYSASDPERFSEITRFSVPSDISSLLYAYDSVWIGLSNGILASLKRVALCGTWDLSHPDLLKLTSDGGPLYSLLPAPGGLYVSWGPSVGLLDLKSEEVIKSFNVKCCSGESRTVQFMSASGVGLWVATKGSPVICLYHTETFRHLQDINIASNVKRVLSARDVPSPSRSIHVSALLAARGLLWVGTNVGIALTVPLPRLEGVPIISGRANISYHAHFGPVAFFLNVVKGVSVVPPPPRPVCNPLPPQNNNVIPEEDESPGVPSNPLRKTPSEGLIPKAAPLCNNFNSLPKGGGIPKTPIARLSPVLLKRDRRRGSKTLPRPTSSSQHAESDVHSLYEDLLNVQQPLDGSSSSGVSRTRKSDPDLSSNAVVLSGTSIPRRLNRPKSLDMSGSCWSMESRLSSSSSSSSSGATPGVSRNASFASNNSSNLSATISETPTATPVSTAPTPNATSSAPSSSRKRAKEGPNTISVIMGGRGIINWRPRPASIIRSGNAPVINNSDAHLVVWETKL